jgi:oxysterol-binding protein 1
VQSETFEYVRFDREYRYMSEQVSHHPPISACWGESPLWHYYGEVCSLLRCNESMTDIFYLLYLKVDAKNKFMGKSFEIIPTGVAHAELVLPKELGPNYPAAKGKGKEGKVCHSCSFNEGIPYECCVRRSSNIIVGRR